MKKTFIVLTLSVWVCIVLADTVKPIQQPKKDDFNTRGLEIKRLIKELPLKKDRLETKYYGGTITEILKSRVADVNEVLQHAVSIRVKAEELCTDANIPDNDLKKLLRYIDKKIGSDSNDIKNRKRNTEIVNFVSKIASDPNTYPEPNDPNYSAEIERMSDFSLAVLEICKPI